MRRYIAVIISLPTGGWRAYLPDLVGCGREADDPDAALDFAIRAAKGQIAQLTNKQVVPLPRSLDQIRADKEWAGQRLVNWSKAIVKLVQL
jgi:predicted RNase H-like HicB family nuclease